MQGRPRKDLWTSEKEKEWLEETIAIVEGKLDEDIEVVLEDWGQQGNLLDDEVGWRRQVRARYGGERNVFIDCYLSGLARRRDALNGKGEMAESEREEMREFAKGLYRYEQTAS